MTEEQDIALEIFHHHGVASDTFIAADAVNYRITYLKEVIRNLGVKYLVLGISGGVDSTTVGRMAKIACDETGTKFIAVRLPYGNQLDEEEAQLALDFIEPHITETVNIKNSVDYLTGVHGPHEFDFQSGNVKARMRMIAQYHIASTQDGLGLVLGTDHNAEFVTGFFTKWGDGACDLTVLTGLNKRQVRACAAYLGAPARLFNKVATADLEDDKPLLPDEIALGFTYDELDDFLEGKKVSDETVTKIVAQYKKTRHKRAWPISPFTVYS